MEKSRRLRGERRMISLIEIVLYLIIIAVCLNIFAVFYLIFGGIVADIIKDRKKRRNKIDSDN
jgi:cell division protein FtsL